MNVWKVRKEAVRYVAVALLLGIVAVFASNYLTYWHMSSSLQCPEPPTVKETPEAQVRDKVEKRRPEPEPEPEPEPKKTAPEAPAKPEPPSEVAAAPPPPPQPRSPPENCIASLSDCLNQINRMRGVKTPTLVSKHEKTTIATRHPVTNVTFKVPNIVHVIRIGDQQPFRFFNYVAFKSYHKYIKPHAIFVWADRLPQDSEWWRKTVEEVPNIYYVSIKPKSKLGGEPIQFVAHAADFLRLEILSKIGGLAFDTDVIILKSFDDVRVYEMSVGRIDKDHVSNGVMAGMKGSRFVQIWMEAYNSYQADNFVANSILMAGKLAELFSHLVHVEARSFTNPTWAHLSNLYAKNWDISENYCLQLYWWKLYYIPDTAQELDGYDCTVGAAMRTVLYGTAKLRDTKNVKVGYVISRDRTHETFQ